MRARGPGGIPYHPLPLAPGVARYPPYPYQLCWRYGSRGASAQAWREHNSGCIRSPSRRGPGNTSEGTLDVECTRGWNATWVTDPAPSTPAATKLGPVRPIGGTNARPAAPPPDAHIPCPPPSPAITGGTAPAMLSVRVWAALALCAAIITALNAAIAGIFRAGILAAPTLATAKAASSRVRPV